MSPLSPSPLPPPPTPPLPPTLAEGLGSCRPGGPDHPFTLPRTVTSRDPTPDSSLREGRGSRSASSVDPWWVRVDHRECGGDPQGCSLGSVCHFGHKASRVDRGGVGPRSQGGRLWRGGRRFVLPDSDLRLLNSPSQTLGPPPRDPTVLPDSTATTSLRPDPSRETRLPFTTAEMDASFRSLVWVGPVESRTLPGKRVERGLRSFREELYYWVPSTGVPPVWESETSFGGS